MKKLLRQPQLRRHGGVAVEFVILLPVMLVLLAAPLLFGRAFWHYTVAQKAAQDAVRFLAAASSAEIKTPGTGGTEAPAAAVARAIVQAEIAELNGGLYPPGVDVLCDGGTCFGFQLPTKVAVRVTIPIYDIFFDDVTADFTGGDQLLLKPVATANYVGN